MNIEAIDIDAMPNDIGRYYSRTRVPGLASLVIPSVLPSWQSCVKRLLPR